jgi:hypothetical protein
MSLFRPTLDERDTLKQAVAKYSHDPMKSRLLALLESDEAEVAAHSPEWNELKTCVGKYHLHVEAELHRKPNHKPTRLQVTKADALARKFTPNFS